MLPAVALRCVTAGVPDPSLDGGYRSATQELALVLAQEMFARLAQHVATVLPKNINVSMREGNDTNNNPGNNIHGNVGNNTSTGNTNIDSHNQCDDDMLAGEDSPDLLLPSPPVMESPSFGETASAVAPRVGGSAPPASPEDPFDVSAMTWVLDEVESSCDEPEQLPRLLLSPAAHLLPALKVSD